jgi:hypothetical protein
MKVAANFNVIKSARKQEKAKRVQNLRKLKSPKCKNEGRVYREGNQKKLTLAGFKQGQKSAKKRAKNLPKICQKPAKKTAKKKAKNLPKICQKSAKKKAKNLPKKGQKSAKNLPKVSKKGKKVNFSRV